MMIKIYAQKFARVDYKTDTIIQQSLRHELGKDVTVITVAHRLQTIMDADKIVSVNINPSSHRYGPRLSFQLVLDAGNIVGRLRCLTEQKSDYCSRLNMTLQQRS